LRFCEEGARVVIAGPEVKPYRGKHGYLVTVETSIRAIEHQQFDGVIIPGGYAPDRPCRH
jgi:protease I